MERGRSLWGLDSRKPCSRWFDRMALNPTCMHIYAHRQMSVKGQSCHPHCPDGDMIQESHSSLTLCCWNDIPAAPLSWEGHLQLPAGMRLPLRLPLPRPAHRPGQKAHPELIHCKWAVVYLAYHQHCIQVTADNPQTLTREQKVE